MNHALSTWDGRWCRACGRWRAPEGICKCGTVALSSSEQIRTCGICGHMHTAGIPCVPGDMRRLYRIRENCTETGFQFVHNYQGSGTWSCSSAWRWMR